MTMRVLRGASLPAPLIDKKPSIIHPARIFLEGILTASSVTCILMQRRDLKVTSNYDAMGVSFFLLGNAYLDKCGNGSPAH